MNKVQDYGEWKGKQLNKARKNCLPPGVEVDINTELYDNLLFGLGMDVELRLIGDTFEERKP
jgi:hypothetical protein